MKKYLFTLLTLLMVNVQWSMLNAQTFVVVDKNGNKTTYDVSKLDSVTFQQNPPSFTVYEETTTEPTQGGETPAEPKQEATTYTFDEVQSIAGDPKFLFAHPDTVYVGADGQTFPSSCAAMLLTTIRPAIAGSPLAMPATILTRSTSLRL